MAGNPHHDTRLLSLSAFLLLFACALSAQEAPAPQLSLRAKETVPIPSEAAGPIMVPVKCDTEGKIYARGYLPRKPAAAPVLKFSAEGNRVAIFDIQAAPGFEQLGLGDFAVGLRGQVYMLAIKSKDEQDIVVFGKDGQHQSTIELKPLFMGEQLAVFLSGEFLVSGRKLSEKRQPTSDRFTAIYDRSGRLVKELDLQEESKITTQKLGSDVKQAEDADTVARKQQAAADARKAEEELAKSIDLGTAEPAEDGNVYLLHPASKPIIYVISPAGELVRRLVIPPPSENYAPIAMKVGGGRMVIQFEKYDPERKSSRRIFSLLDAESGEKIADYVSPPEIGGALACYTPNGFTFLTSTQDRKLALLRAVPQ